MEFEAEKEVVSRRWQKQLFSTNNLRFLENFAAASVFESVKAESCFDQRILENEGEKPLL